MSEWNEYCLGDVCDITSSRRIFLNEYSNSGVPFYRSKEIIEKAKGNSISTELYITQERYDEIKKRNFVPVENDILITSVGTLGVSYLVSSNDYFYFKDGNLTWLRSFSDCVFPKYLLYWLRSPLGKETINEISIGSTQPAITIQGVSVLKLKLPPVALQNSTAEILSSIDDKIELNNKINKELEALAQTLFKQWFIDFEFPNENGEPYKSSGGEMVDSELGEIPKEWKIGNLGGLVDIINGYAFKSKDFNNSFEEGIIKIRNINGTTVDLINTDFVSTEVVNKLNDKFKVKPGDILIAMTGAEVGKIGVVGKTMKRLWLNQRVGKLMPKTNKHVSYIHTMYNVLNLTEVIRNEAMGSAQPNISSQGIESIKLLMPKTSLITMFSELFDDKFKWFLSSIAENQELVNLRDTLLPKLISGELEINEISK